MRRLRSRSTVLVPFGALLSTATFAHEGHGVIATAGADGWLHWLLEPQHALAVLGVVLLAAMAVRPALRKRSMHEVTAKPRPR